MKSSKICTLLAVTLLATLAIAQEHISCEDKDDMIFWMKEKGDALYFDGEKWLITPSVLETYEKVTPDMYRDMVYFSSRGLNFFNWGYYGGGMYGTFDCSWMLKGKKLYMKELRTNRALLDGMMSEKTKEAMERGMLPFSTDTLLIRMERATGCKFSKDSTMFMKNYTGEFYAKKANTAKRPDVKWEQNVWEFPEYIAWWQEPIYKLSFKNGRLEKMTALEEVPEPEYGDSIFDYNDQLHMYPKFGTGDYACANHIQKHVSYPEESLQAGHEGVVELSFVVEKDGSIGEVQIEKSSGYAALDEAALAAMCTMAPWRPAANYGRPVRCRLYFAVTFFIPEAPNEYPPLPKGYRQSSTVVIRPPRR